MAMGNPDGAKASESSPNAYLITRPTYSLSSINPLALPIGAAGTSVPLGRDQLSAILATLFLINRYQLPGIRPGMLIIPTLALTATADRRGYLCPSDDRDSTAEENMTTFILTNIVPQAPQLNRQSWLRL
nr:DNA/RNA non-specific endonuclease [Spirosoma radiotolerans]